MKNWYPIALGISILFFAGLLIFASKKDLPTVDLSNNQTETEVKPTEKSMQKPQLTIDTKKVYTAILKTDKGDITVELSSKTPITTNNFVYLAREKLYDNTIFHRTIKGFMIQGGDPDGDGTGGPGYRFEDEEFEGEYKRGTIAMANAGPDTNGSQFFIMHQDFELPANYVIFGKVTNGMEVVDKIAESEVTTSPSGEESKPVTPTVVKSVEITEK